MGLRVLAGASYYSSYRFGLRAPALAGECLMSALLDLCFISLNLYGLMNMHRQFAFIDVHLTCRNISQAASVEHQTEAGRRGQ